MPYRQQQLVNDEIYHIVIRAIDDNLIFKDIDDYYRGIFSIYEFNNLMPITIRERRRIRTQLKQAYRGPTSAETSAENYRGPTSADAPIFINDERDKLVEVLSFCIMPNHIHLLVKQLKEGGISKFMVKIGTGYGGYFNRKYNRKGYVFQNRFLDVHIKDDNQLKIVFTYIHTNPISLIEPNWKEIGIENPERVIKFLENYKWSSFLDYIGKKNFISVTDRRFMSEIMDYEQGCKNFIENWVRYKGEIKEYPNLSLE